MNCTLQTRFRRRPDRRCYTRGMDLLTCPTCGANWREVGVKEYGLVYFETRLLWDADKEFFEGNPEQTKYGDCSHMDWACPRCGHVLDDDPDSLAADSD
jgi:uncharacterized C2H2 Zn-finger protein